MTNELEKTFFDTFGIEPEILNGCKFERCLNINKGVINCIKEECPHYYKDKVEYPQITDRILLELIIILGTICTVFNKNVDDLKENVLKNLIELSGRYHIYNKVRTLFEEER